MIIAGTGLDVYAQLPALAAVAEGYDAFVVVDACGRFEPVPSVATISRLTQAEVALVNARVIVLEAMADNAHPKAEEIYAIESSRGRVFRTPRLAPVPHLHSGRR